MKKFILTLSCALAMVSCSEDAFQEVEKQSEETGGIPNQANSFNNDDSGYVNGPGGLKEPGKNYYSPWDIWFNRANPNQQPAYNLSNGNVENISPYTLEVFAWVGLAYYDGNDDGIYNDLSLPVASQPVANMAANPTQFTNLYPNGHEVGNLIRTVNPILLNPQTGMAIEDKLDHLPTINSSNLKYGSNFFDFGGTLSTAEDNLIREYGKVFFYEVNVFEAGAFVGTYFMHPEIQNLPNPSTAAYWKPITNSSMQVQGNMPPLGNFDLYYIDNPNVGFTTWNPNYGLGSPNDNECDSHEVVFHVPMPLHAQTISGSVPKTLGMGFTHNPFTLWLNSSLTLGVY